MTRDSGCYTKSCLRGNNGARAAAPQAQMPISDRVVGMVARIGGTSFSTSLLDSGVPLNNRHTANRHARAVALLSHSEPFITAQHFTQRRGFASPLTICEGAGGTAQGVR